MRLRCRKGFHIQRSARTSQTAIGALSTDDFPSHLLRSSLDEPLTLMSALI
jgi:hypothetical protein